MSGVNTGRDFRLDISEDAGATWQIIGPVTTKDLSNSSPTVDVTTQSDSGDYSDFCHSGYAQSTISANGFVKEVTGTDPISGLDFYTYKAWSTLANGPVEDRKALLRLSDDLEAFEGTYLISEFSRTGDQSSVQEFSTNLQGTADVTHTPVP